MNIVEEYFSKKINQHLMFTLDLLHFWTSSCMCFSYFEYHELPIIYNSDNTITFHRYFLLFLTKVSFQHVRKFIISCLSIIELNYKILLQRYNVSEYLKVVEREGIVFFEHMATKWLLYAKKEKTV